MTNTVTPTEGQPNLAEQECDLKIDCERQKEKWNDPCSIKEMCAMIASMNAMDREKFQKQTPSPSNKGHPSFGDYQDSLRDFANNFKNLLSTVDSPDDPAIKNQFHAECRHEEWKEGKFPPNEKGYGYEGLSPDHIHPVQFNGRISDLNNMRWVHPDVNHFIGGKMQWHYQPPKKIKVPPCCQ